MKEWVGVILTHLAAVILGAMIMFTYLTKVFYGSKDDY